MGESLPEIIPSFLKVRPRAKLGFKCTYWCKKNHHTSQRNQVSQGDSLSGENLPLRENGYIELPIIFDEKDHPSLSTVYSFNDINDGIARQPP